MPEADSVTFAQMAHRLAAAARQRGLRPPVFRSPPRRAGALRTLRRRPDGAVVVAVVVRGRSAVDVGTDLVEGLLAANGRTGDAASAHRPALLAAALGQPDAQAA